MAFLKATGLAPKQTSAQSPWQNGVAERWVGSCRREMLDHVIALNEPHLRRIIRDYVSYHHQDRIHDSLEKDTPNRRLVEPKPSPGAVVISNARLGAAGRRAARNRHVPPLVFLLPTLTQGALRCLAPQKQGVASPLKIGGRNSPDLPRISS